MNAPNGELDPDLLLQRFTPCQYVFVDAVDKRPVEIEQECRWTG
jgi:hypothetical protein